VIAHRNKFNLWTAGPDQFFFDSENECATALETVQADSALLAEARAAARRQCCALFTWERILADYKDFVGLITVRIEDLVAWHSHLRIPMIVTGILD
jgi:hypothetical protein